MDERKELEDRLAALNEREKLIKLRKEVEDKEFAMSALGRLSSRLKRIGDRLL